MIIIIPSFRSSLPSLKKSSLRCPARRSSFCPKPANSLTRKSEQPQRDAVQGGPPRRYPAARPLATGGTDPLPPLSSSSSPRRAFRLRIHCILVRSQALAIDSILLLFWLDAWTLSLAATIFSFDFCGMRTRSSRCSRQGLMWNGFKPFMQCGSDGGFSPTCGGGGRIQRSAAAAAAQQ